MLSACTTIRGSWVELLVKTVRPDVVPTAVVDEIEEQFNMTGMMDRFVFRLRSEIKNQLVKEGKL